MFNKPIFRVCKGSLFDFANRPCRGPNPMVKSYNSKIPVDKLPLICNFPSANCVNLSNLEVCSVDY